jgi:hypothetical protein
MRGYSCEKCGATATSAGPCNCGPMQPVKPGRQP